MKNLMRALGVVAIAGALSGSHALAQQGSANLDAVLKQLDAASAKFQSAEADFRWDQFERVVQATTTQSGSIYFEREKGANAVQMGAVIGSPAAKVLQYQAGVLRVFDSGPNQLTELTAGANRAQYESFLTLGFGGSGKDLAAAWTIKDDGSEPMSDGSGTIPVEKLELVSKDPNARNTFQQVVIWVDLKRAISLKQQFLTPSGDMKTAVYTHVRYNQKVNTGKYAIKTDKNTKIDRR